MYDLCTKFQENIFSNYIFVEDPQLLNKHMNDIDCELFIDKQYSSSVELNICQNYTNKQELYFMTLFGISNISTNIFVNADCFNISTTLLSPNININIMEYTECSSNIKALPSSTTFYVIFPCNIDTASPTSFPSSLIFI